MRAEAGRGGRARVAAVVLVPAIALAAAGLPWAALAAAAKEFVQRNRTFAVTEAEIEAGRAQMADAFDEFVSPGGAERHDLLITHNLVIAEFVRHAFDAPEWRWLGLTQAHCGLTVLKVRSGRPVTLVSHNDLAHLPVELRTGLVEPLPF